MSKGKCFAFIFARGGSKGLPRKNIKLLAGKPLISYSIEIAQRCPSIDAVYVSTDDEEIAAVAEQFGAKVPFIRPAELAADTSSEWDAWRHAIDELESRGEHFDTFISLPATAPLRSVEDVEACIVTLSTDVDMVVTAKKAERSPYFNMVTIDNDGFSRLVIEPENTVSRRQDAPVVYDMTTVAYVTRPSFIKGHSGVFDGQVKTVIIPDDRAVDIDTVYDFMMAEFILKGDVQ